MVKYRFKFIVETDEDPNIIFHKIWDALKEFNEDHFGSYQIIHSHEDWIKILTYCHAIMKGNELSQEVLSKKIKEHIEELIKEKRKQDKNKKRENKYKAL